MYSGECSKDQRNERVRIERAGSKLTWRTVTGIRVPSVCHNAVMPCFLASTPVRFDLGVKVGLGEEVEGCSVAAVANVRMIDCRLVDSVLKDCVSDCMLLGR
jgi:hypothetical protein